MQYSEGTVALTPGSPIVTGTGTYWLSNVNNGFVFKLIDDEDFYDILSVDSDTQITLGSNYTGLAPISGASYIIMRDFTYYFHFPTISRGSVNWPEIVSRAITLIDLNLYETQDNKEVKSITFEPMVAPPDTVEGNLYYDHLTHRFKFWDGTSWVTVVVS
jgi:hypothetical protein